MSDRERASAPTMHRGGIRVEVLNMSGGWRAVLRVGATPLFGVTWVERTSAEADAAALRAALDERTDER